MRTLVPMRFAGTRLLWTADGIYSPAECREMIRRIESWSPTLATNNPIYRNQDRVIRDEPDLARDLFRRLRPHLPERIGDLHLHGLNERLRFYRYQPGQCFAPHTDHWYQPDDKHITLLTVLAYFNDDFDGGETVFVEHVEATVQPKPGLVALFQHKVRHEGREVTRGRKFAMRADALYRAPHPIHLTLE